MFDLKNVASVYSGKAHKCMCGCAGKHTYASAHREWASKNRGYDISDDEVSDHAVKIIFGRLLALGPPKCDGHEDARGRDYIYAEVGDRIYAAYFRKERTNCESSTT